MSPGDDSARVLNDFGILIHRLLEEFPNDSGQLLHHATFGDLLQPRAAAPVIPKRPSDRSPAWPRSNDSVLN